MQQPPPAHQNHLLLQRAPFPTGFPGFKGQRSSEMVTRSFADSTSQSVPEEDYCADDEEEQAEEVQYPEQPLDLSCKPKAEENGRRESMSEVATRVITGVKRGREEDDSGDQGRRKKIRLEGNGKRKHLRKKRSDLPVNAGGMASSSGAKFGNGSVLEADDSSTDEEDKEEKNVKVLRRGKKRVLVREKAGLDVDEHFRRSLGEHVWNKIAGKTNNGAKEDQPTANAKETHVGVNNFIKPITGGLLRPFPCFCFQPSSKSLFLSSSRDGRVMYHSLALCCSAIQLIMNRYN